MSKYILGLILLVFVGSYLFYTPWKNGHILGGGDSWGYYAYLPAKFIYNDLDSLHRTVAKRYEYAVNHGPAPDNPLGVHEAHPVGDGRQVFKYTMGVAILQLPFFALAHFIAHVLGYAPDGYSLPYLFLILFAGACYSFVGLVFLRKVLLHYFSDNITTVVLLTVALGTNLYYFSVFNPGMSHAYLFALYAMLLYATIRFYDDPKIKWGFLIGLCCGFITVIRPVELICVLIPVLYGVTSLKLLHQRVGFVAGNFRQVGAAVIGAILAGLPQLIYWKVQTGHWLHYSYKNETFDFLHPHLKGGLIGFSNGWLSYTPLMIFGVIGFWWLYKRKNPFSTSILLFMPIHIYVAYSWWCWYYINGFGSRPMVETYALMAIPMGYVFTSLSLSLVKRVGLTLVLLFFGLLNLFQTYQFSLGVLWTEVANFAYYRGVFGKTELEYRDLVMFDSGEWQPKDLVFDRTLVFHNFEDTTLTQVNDTIVYDGKQSFVLTKEIEFSPGIAGTLDSLQLNGGEYVKVSAQCYSNERVFSWWDMSRLVVEMRNETPKFKKWRGVRIQSKPGNDDFSLWGGKGKVWGEVSMFVKVPNNAPRSTMLKAYALNNSNFPVYLDNLKLEVWVKK